MTHVQTLDVALRAPDWERIASDPPRQAAQALTGLLSSLDTVVEAVFAVRGRVLMAMEERQLWRELADPATGKPFHSFDAWLAATAKRSRSDCYAALRAVRELRDVPFEELSRMPRVNIEQLRKVSTGVRAKPEVRAAAVSLPEKEFVDRMNREHDQHLEQRKPVVMPSAGEAEEVELAIRMAMVLEECSRSEAVVVIAVSYIQENAVAYEQRKAEA